VRSRAKTKFLFTESVGSSPLPTKPQHHGAWSLTAQGGHTANDDGRACNPQPLARPPAPAWLSHTPCAGLMHPSAMHVPVDR
jgi:hypothetical protein